MQKKPIKAGLLGLPLSGSLSPVIFGIFSGLTGEEIVYEKRECGEAELASVIEALGAEGWAGFNVTIPYKRAVFNLLNLRDPASRDIGAVNAVRFGRKGLEGLNTDAAAVRLRPLLHEVRLGLRRNQTHVDFKFGDQLSEV